MSENQICHLEGCINKHYARGYCEKHYLRWRRHGHPLGGRTSPGVPLRWLEENVGYHGDDCLRWPFADDGKGYGVVKVDGQQTSAHRAMCKLVHGDPPTADHEVAHSCGQGHLRCVNPNHLRWATRSENHADKLTHGTHNRGERCPTADLTESQVRQILSLKGIMLKKDIAAQFGVSLSHVSNIHLGKRWSWLSG